jgi:hypothetical protein
VDFPFSHDIEGLIELCGASACEVPALLAESAGLLTPNAVRHRYGGDPPALVNRETARKLADAGWPGHNRSWNPAPELVARAYP